MKYTEMRLSPDAPVWAAPEAFLSFIQDLLREHGPVLLVLDEKTPGTLEKVNTNEEA